MGAIQPGSNRRHYGGYFLPGTPPGGESPAPAVAGPALRPTATTKVSISLAYLTGNRFFGGRRHPGNAASGTIPEPDRLLRRILQPEAEFARRRPDAGSSTVAREALVPLPAQSERDR